MPAHPHGADQYAKERPEYGRQNGQGGCDAQTPQQQFPPVLRYEIAYKALFEIGKKDRSL